MRSKTHQRICADCGKAEMVRSDHKHTRYCKECAWKRSSPAFMQRRARPTQTLECDNCKVKFQRTQCIAARNVHNFCCMKCRMEFSRVEVTCKSCGRLFTIPHGRTRSYGKKVGFFCCRACFTDWRVGIKRRDHKITDKARKAGGIKQVLPKTPKERRT